jgi:hypothetical protein
MDRAAESRAPWGAIKLGGDPGAAPAEREGFEKQIGYFTARLAPTKRPFFVESFWALDRETTILREMDDVAVCVMQSTKSI